MSLWVKRYADDACPLWGRLVPQADIAEVDHCLKHMGIA